MPSGEQDLLMSVPEIILTCEHAGKKIPAEFAMFFQGAEKIVDSHRGWDPGALEAARKVAHDLDLPLRYTLWTRLLIEANREKNSPELFSEFTAVLPDPTKDSIIRNYYEPYRNDVKQRVSGYIRNNPVVHLAIHSFTPDLNGEIRNADIGILFDPSREFETEIAGFLFDTLNKKWIVKHNYPYPGTDDSLTTTLRTLFPDRQYAGLEIELNQKYYCSETEKWEMMKSDLSSAIKNLQLQIHGKV